MVCSNVYRSVAFAALLTLASCGDRPTDTRALSPTSSHPTAQPRSEIAPDAATATATPIDTQTGTARDGGAPALESRKLTVGEARAHRVVRSEPLLLSHGATVPGPCVDPSLDVALALTNDPTIDDPLERVDLLPIDDFDLDGDGVPDTYTFIGGGVQDQGDQRLYVLRGDCGYPVGEVITRNGVHLLPHLSHGLHDLQTLRFAANWKTSEQVTYRFNGHRYIEIAHRRAKDIEPQVLQGL